MGRVVVRSLTAVAVLGTVVAAPGAAGAAHRSGVSGRVVRDGPCTVVREPRCDNQPVAVTIRVKHAHSGRLVRTVHTATGHFRVRLQPGRYRLQASRDHGKAAGSVRMRVERHRFTSAVIHLRSPAP